MGHSKKLGLMELQRLYLTVAAHAVTTRQYDKIVTWQAMPQTCIMNHAALFTQSYLRC